MASTKIEPIQTTTRRNYVADVTGVNTRFFLCLSLFLLAGVLLAPSAHASSYSFVSLDVPGVSDTFATGINNSGQIAGYFSNPDSQAPEHGFVYNGGSFATFDVPGARGTLPGGINNSGQVVGYYTASGDVHGFTFNGATFTSFDAPGTWTLATGINDSGQIVGAIRYDANGYQRGFLNNGGVFTGVNPPGSSQAYAYGINNNGQIVGWFQDSTGTGSHGWLISANR